MSKGSLDRFRSGFTLPTVMIVSIIMFGVLALAMQQLSVSSVSLQEIHYSKLAREAAESGANMIKACWKSGVDVPLSATLTPATNCSGTTITAQSTTLLSIGITTTTFEAKVELSDASGRRVAKSVGKVSVGSGVGLREYNSEAKINQSLSADPAEVRASQRFWYFGVGAGLDFGVSGSALPKTIYPANKMVPVSGVPIEQQTGAAAFEGSTVVTNKRGELVFWTDGRTVWNKNGQIAYNSTGLLGSSSATQAASAFPLNREQTRYGIVTNTTGSVDSECTGSPFTSSQKWRLYFSIYDTTLDGGNGGIATAYKNIDMYPSYNNASFGGNGYASEAMNVLPNSDGSGYWVYTYSKDVAGATSGNRVLGFLVRTDGTISSPVTYSLPTAPTLCGTASPGKSVYGTINFSSDYTKMLVLIGTSSCHITYPITDANRQNSGTVYVLSTNRKTGALVQQKSWPTRVNHAIADPNPRPASTANYPRNSGYSADFSPNGNFVYVTQLYPGWLTRYDATAASPVTTQHTVAHTSRGTPAAGTTNNTFNGGGQVRRGPDGRMYISSNPYAGTFPVPASSDRNNIICITNPDAVIYASLAVLGYQNPCQGVSLGTSYSWYGLPQMATVYVPEVVYF